MISINSRNLHGSSLMLYLKEFSSFEKRLRLMFMFFLLFSFLLLPGNFLSNKAFAERTVYSIQLGAFIDADNAKEMTEDLIKLGHNSFYREEKKGGKTIYRVYIEKYRTQEEAKREAEILKNLDLISVYSIKKISLLNNSQYTVEKNNLLTGEGIYLHIESYGQEANAKKRVNELKRYGLKSFYNEETVAGVKWYRIYLGDFSNEEDARRKGAELKNEGIINYFKPRKLNKH